MGCGQQGLSCAALCGLASGPLLLSLSFNSPSSICTWSIPNLTKLTNPALFSAPSCLLSGSYCVSPGVRGLSQWSAHLPGQLVPPKSQQGLPRSLMPQGMQRGASSTGTCCLLPKAKPGSPFLLPHGPSPLKTSVHPNVRHCCGRVFHRSTLL